MCVPSQACKDWLWFPLLTFPHFPSPCLQFLTFPGFQGEWSPCMDGFSSTPLTVALNLFIFIVYYTLLLLINTLILIILPVNTPHHSTIMMPFRTLTQGGQRTHAKPDHHSWKGNFEAVASPGHAWTCPEINSVKATQHGMECGRRLKCTRRGCTLAPHSEYNWTVSAQWQCGLM